MQYMERQTNSKHASVAEQIRTILNAMMSTDDGIEAMRWYLMAPTFPIDFCSNILSSKIAEVPSTILDTLIANDRELYKEALKVISHGAKIFAQNYGDVALGGSTKEVKETIDEEGYKTVVSKSKSLSVEARKALLTVTKAPEQTYLSNRDISISEIHFGITEKRYVIPERLINSQISKLQPYQFAFYSILRKYLTNSNAKDTWKGENLFLHLVGGYQSGKTVASNTMLAVMMNRLANNKRSTGDYMLMSAKMSSLHRNVINRLCAIYPSLTPPSINSTVWKLAEGVKISLLTTQLISFHSLKGASISFCYVDEIDSMHREVLDLLPTRLTEKFDDGHGDKCVLITTSNPKSPDHHVTKFLYPEDEHGKPVNDRVTLRVSTEQNSHVSDEYLKSMERRCGGRDTNKYQREIRGYSVHLASEHNIFTIDEGVHFVDDTIDDYVQFRCRNCSSEFVLRPIEECSECVAFSGKIKKKDFFKVNIGHDFGTSVQKVYCCTFFYREKGVVKAIVLDELVFEGGHDAKFSKEHGLEALNRKKERDIIDMVMRCKQLCSDVTIYIPHDAAQQVIEVEGIVAKNSLGCSVSRPPAPNSMPITESIDLMRKLFDTGRLTISHSCKNLKSQLFAYQYDQRACEETGEEKIKKVHDHSVDALRYSIIPQRDILIG